MRCGTVLPANEGSVPGNSKVDEQLGDGSDRCRCVRLIIAEKPSLARAIATAIPGHSRRVHHHIECANGDVVAWCAGHIVGMAPPEDYRSGLEHWTLEALPIVPEEWRLRATARELLNSIQGLLQKATRVVHAGDPDREGQLLVDEVLHFLGWKGPTERLLVTDLTPTAVFRALHQLEPNYRFESLYRAALARQRADWLYGMNMTRLYTLRARETGYDGVLSVGRVQTPVLGLVVRRDREIEAFKPQRHFGVEATFATASGETFWGTWAVGREWQTESDSEGRLLSKSVAEAVGAKVAGQAATVIVHEQKHHAEGAPLPYSLPQLQIDAGKGLGLSASRVLELAQGLYEKQLITYPRSDCGYLPEAQFGDAARVLEAAALQLDGFGKVRELVDSKVRSRAWNDAKITAHHAIIPTAYARGRARLEGSEIALYEMIARRYIQQFMPDYEYQSTKAELRLAGETFLTKGREVVALGWQALRQAPRQEVAESVDGDRENSVLPALERGQIVSCVSARVAEKQTRPPSAFTDASLIQAMCNVAKYVTDPRARQILQDADGIGTPATRAAILELLLERKYLKREKKALRSTPVGRALIDALPGVATTPDMTALWETGMQAIQAGSLELEHFLGAVTAQLQKLVALGKAQEAPSVAPRRACPRQGCTGHMRRLKGVWGPFWSCKVCRATASADEKQVPVQAKRKRSRSKRPKPGMGSSNRAQQ